MPHSSKFLPVLGALAGALFALPLFLLVPRLAADTPSRVPAVLARPGGAPVSHTPRSGAPAGTHVRPADLPIELAESVPVETQLGNPELRSARTVWLEMLGHAQHKIDLEGFYFSSWPGEALEPVVAALGQAAKRGVQVRLLFDRGMSATYPQPLDSLGKLPGFTARKIDFHRIAGGVQHSKYFIVDDAEVYVGSQNMDWRSLDQIHELGVRVRDERIAQDFGAVFAWDWTAADTTSWSMRTPPGTDGAPRKLPEPPTPQHVEAPLSIVQMPGDTAIVWPSYSPRGWLPDSARWDETTLVRLIDGAQHEVVVQSLTYAPQEYALTDTSLDHALRAAAARGVQVKLVISDWEQNSRALPWLQRLGQVPNIAIKLSTVPDWSKAYIPFARVEHCKYMVVDGHTLWVGTANWGAGYFLSTRNLALTFEDRRLAQQARKIFEASWSGPTAADLRTEGTYPRKTQGETPPPGKTAYGK